MTKQRILIVGGSGMLGHKLTQVIGTDDSLDVHVVTRSPIQPAFAVARVTYHYGLDLSKSATAVTDLIALEKPAVVINAVGAIKQKRLESAVDETFFVNGILPHAMAYAVTKIGGRVIHFSTDCVFRGDTGGYLDTDNPNALDLYGRSKAIGEINYGPHLTIRTSIVGFELSGFHGLLSWLLSIPAGTAASGYTHAIFSGLPTVTLAQTVRDLCVRPDIHGLYNVASTPISKFDLLTRLGAALGLSMSLVPNSELRIDRSLNDHLFREATGTTTPKWQGLITDLVNDFHRWPYRQLISNSSTTQNR